MSLERRLSQNYSCTNWCIDLCLCTRPKACCSSLLETQLKIAQMYCKMIRGLCKKSTSVLAWGELHIELLDQASGQCTEFHESQTFTNACKWTMGEWMPRAVVTDQLWSLCPALGDEVVGVGKVSSICNLLALFELLQTSGTYLAEWHKSEARKWCLGGLLWSQS